MYLEYSWENFFVKRRASKKHQQQQTYSHSVDVIRNWYALAVINCVFDSFVLWLNASLWKWCKRTQFFLTHTNHTANIYNMFVHHMYNTRCVQRTSHDFDSNALQHMLVLLTNTYMTQPLHNVFIHINTHLHDGNEY